MTAVAPLSRLAERGAVPLPDGGVRFAVWAPLAATASVRIHAPVQRVVALERAPEGVFSAIVPDIAAGADYSFVLDRGPDRPDPLSRHQPHGVHGPSRVVDPGAFSWTDGAWRGRPMHELVIYELHVGTFTPAGTFDAAIERLDHLVDLGVTAVEVMPVAQFPGARNWGYDGVALYAPAEAYGGPDGLRRFVDAAHTRGLAVVLDVVYNHLGPEGNYLAEFGPYFTDRYRTPWGLALNYDDAGSDEVRRYVVDNAVHWVAEYHVDALRLDAVHAIYDFSARHVLEELGDAVRRTAEALGRRAIVIAESDLNDPRVVRGVDRGGWGLDAQWSDDFHHALHVALTGERGGYYADFAGLEDLATAIERRFVYAGRRSAHRGRRHGASAADVPADRFVVFAQNHDQIGNRAQGERLTTLVSLNACKVAAALTLLSPYVPLIFMGDEWAETNPFLYFVSHGDAALNDAVRRGRTEEFRAFAWQGDVPDPAAAETFARSRIEWERRTASGHAGMLRLYRDLLRLRRDAALLRPGAAAVSTRFDASAGWLTVRYDPARGRTGDRTRSLLVVASCRPDAADARVPLREPGAWELVLSTDDPPYDGQGLTTHDGTIVTLPGYGAAVFRGGE